MVSPVWREWFEFRDEVRGMVESEEANDPEDTIIMSMTQFDANLVLAAMVALTLLDDTLYEPVHEFMQRIGELINHQKLDGKGSEAA